MYTPIPDQKPSHCGCSHACDSTNTPASTPLETQILDGGLQRTQIRIMQMDCPTEEGLIRKKFKNFDAIHTLEFNLIQRVLTVVHTPDALPKILKSIQELGFEPELPSADGTHITTPTEPKHAFTGLIIAAIFASIAEITHYLDGSMWIVIATSLLAIALSGLTTYKKGWIALRHGNLNINALMSIAVTGAIIIGSWPEAAMVMVLFNLAELIEAKSLARARNAIGALLNLVPTKVMMLQSNGQWQAIDAKQVPVGASIRVHAGEKIGLDGVITDGHSSINQAAITGESIAVEKNIGDTVFAGTLNLTGVFEYRVTANADNTTLAKIIHAVENAQQNKAPTQRFVDRFAQIYTPVVFIAAVAIAIFPPLFGAGNWLDWIYKALVLLVIACPCALVISTPVTVVSGLAAAAKKGILIKGGAYLEMGHRLKMVALDKTGTITYGQPKLTDFVLLAGDESDAKSLFASLAQQSDHPISKAIYAAFSTQTIFKIQDFSAHIGFGSQAQIQDDTVYLGNHRFIHAHVACSAQIEQQILQLEQQAKTVVLLCKNNQILAMVAVADTIKATSQEAIASLHKMGVQTIMLSGDNPHTAQQIAKQVGIDTAQGGLLPEDKFEVIHNLAQKHSVAMVGDGINDAPALARADIGFAMGAIGSDTAIETADVALMDDDLRKLPSFIRLSNMTHRVLIQNIGLALGVKFLFVLLTLANMGTLWMAVFADVGVSLLVVANGLRLLKIKF